MAACVGGGQPSIKEVSSESARLGDAIAAFYLSPQTYNFGGPGFLVLVAPDGTTSAVRTAGMDNADPVWTNAGLYFWDVERDYLLADRLVSWPGPKPNRQDGAVVTANGVVAAIFNEGETRGGYRERLVAHQRGGPVGLNVAGYNQVVAACDESIVGVAEVSGERMAARARERGVSKDGRDGRVPLMLTQLYRESGLAEQRLLGAESSFEPNTPVGAVPCEAGVVTYPVWLVSPSGPHPVIRRWDTRTGRSTQRAMTAPNGSALAIDVDTLAAATVAPRLDEAGHLVWFGGDGIMRSTDPSTGTTVDLSNSGLPLDDAHDTEVVFRGRYVFLLDVPNDDLGRPLTLHRRLVSTGVGTPLVTIEGINQLRSAELVLRGLVVSPQLEAG